MTTVSAIKVKIQRKAVVKFKVLTRFPAEVIANTFLTVTRTGATYAFDVDYTKLANSVVSDPTTAMVAVLDQTAETYKLVSLASLLTSGLDADIQAIAALTGTGILTRTAANTWVVRAVTGTANEITVVNGDGVAGNPTISLPAAITGTGKTWTGGNFAGLTITTSTFNGNTWTAGTGTLTLGAGKTATISNTLTFTGTDGTSFAFPGTSDTVVTLSATQTLTNKSINATSNPITNLTTAMFATNVVDNDGALTANSSTRVPTQAAVKAYSDALIAANDAMVFKGVIDCSANPNYPAADRGWTYKVSVAGKIGGASGVSVEIGDTLLCITDGTVSGNQATVGAAWNIVQANLVGAVTGPASSTTGNIATFNGTGGTVIQDGGKALPTGAIVGTTDSQTLTNKSIAATQLTGALQAAQFPALTGDITTTAGALGTTLATVNSNVGSFGSVSAVPTLTVNGKGQVTAASSAAYQNATSAVKGIVQVDGTTITASGGVITAVGAVSTAVAVGTTSVTSGTSGRILYNNAGVLGELATIPVANGGTGDTGTAWTTYTPTITAGGGSFTTVSASGRYKQIGKSVFIQVSVVVTNVGTANGFFTASLPAGMTMAANCPLSGNNVSANILMVSSCLSGTTTIVFTRYDNTSMGVTSGQTVSAAGVIEIT